jgi:uncharacterized protein
MNSSQFLKKYGSWALVTGATSGIGQELSLLLAQNGLNVILVGRSTEKLHVTAELVKQKGVRVETILADFEQASAVQTVIESTRNHDIGLFIPAAGFGDSGLFVEADLSFQSAMLEVNINSVVALTHHFANRMKKQGRGGIVLIGSLLAYHGTPYSAVYAASKAFVLSFGEALAVEMKKTGVDILVSNPGPTQTGFGQRASMNMGKAMSPQLVATATLAALGKSHTVLPGYLSKLLRSALITAPRFLQVRIIGNIMKGFSQKP